jgi:flagellar basal body-associated protein FliL
MPTMPPPPPPFAPGEEADAEAPSGRKAPSRKVIAIAAAVVILLGGGYYYTTTTGSSSGSDSGTAAATLAANKAKLAALRAKAAAAGKTGTSAATATGAAGAKPVTGAKPVVPAKGAAKPVTPAKGATKPAPAAKPAVKPVTNGAKPVASSVAFHAALPGRIGLWSKLVVAKVPTGLAKYDPDLGTTPSDIQEGYFGGTLDQPYLYVETGNHSPKAAKTALQILQAGVPDLQKLGFVVAPPFAVSHAPYGGTAACTTLTANDVLGVACFWIDNNTFGFISAPHRVESQARSILAMVRGSVEH